MNVERTLEVKVIRMMVVKVESRRDVKMETVVVLKVQRVVITEANLVTTTSLCWRRKYIFFQLMSRKETAQWSTLTFLLFHRSLRTLCEMEYVI